jgi:YVTN family beta-propeller protein
VSVETYLRVGTELLGYRIERVLGRGGMGVVYLAHQLALERMVALKLLAPELAADEHFRERFLNESRLAASLDHPSIVTVIDAGEVDGRLYIAMRYVEGTDLRHRLESEAPLEPGLAVSLLAPIADALDAAHARGLVHRDVKPSNVLLDQEGHVYLADFGVARPVSEGGLVEQSHFTASIEYVSPEQIAGAPVGPTADVYSLGCVLYECLTGQSPFRDESLIAVLWGHVNDTPTPASERRPELPAAIDAVLEKALAKAPAERYPTCGELVSTARGALGLDAPVVVRSRRRIAIAVAGLVALLAGVAVAAAIVLTGGGTKTDALVRIDPAANRVADRLGVGHRATGVAVGAGAVWLSSQDDGAVWRVDADTHRLQRIAGYPEAGDLAVHGQDVYVAFRDGIGDINTVNLDRAASTVHLVRSPAQTPSVAAGKLGAWVADKISPAVEKLGLSPTADATGLLETVPIARVGDEENGFDVLTAVAVGEGAVWATGDALEPALFRVDPTTRHWTRLPLPSAPGSLAAGDGAVWVAGQIDDVVWRVDPHSGRVTDTIPVGRGVSGVAVGAGGVWVASAIDGTVTRIDPTRRRVVATIDVGGQPEGIAVGEGGVWVASRAD